MKRRDAVVVLMVMVMASSALAVELDVVKLPSPRTDGGKPLMQALKARQSQRAYSERDLPDQLLADLLWAACGVNRPDGRMTSPTAHGWQQIDVYVALKKGLFLYNRKDNTLDPVMAKDIRKDTGKQGFVGEAPAELIFVTNHDRMLRAEDEAKAFYSATDTGFVSQNVYLFCASEGLATVVRGWVDKEALARVMGLTEQQKVILCQTVGYPAE